MPDEFFYNLSRYNNSEKGRVKALGDDIGYGRLMQLSEQIQEEKKAGQAFSMGCYTYNLVPCPHPEVTEDKIHCEWCCGCGRVTKRVLQAMMVCQ